MSTLKLDIARKARKILNAKDRWTKGLMAAKRYGVTELPTTSPAAYRFCLAGALSRATYFAEKPTNYVSSQTLAELDHALQEVQRDLGGKVKSGYMTTDARIMDFNDRDETKYEDVTRLLDEYIDELIHSGEPFTGTCDNCYREDQQVSFDGEAVICTDYQSCHSVAVQQAV